MPLGGIIALAVLLPNLLMLAMPPQAVPPNAEKKDERMKLMEILERAGQAGCFVIPFFYQLPALRNANVDALIVMGLALALYYTGWARYALKGHRFILLYAPLMGVRLPMAISPVVFFAAAALFLMSWPLAIATVLLAAGHLYVSMGEWKRCQGNLFLQTG